MKRWEIVLMGGVVTIGGAYRLDVSGSLVVEADSPLEARQRAEAILERKHRDGSVVPDEGLIVEQVDDAPPRLLGEDDERECYLASDDEEIHEPENPPARGKS